MIGTHKHMQRFDIELGGTPLPYDWGIDCQDDIIDRIAGEEPDRILVVTDDRVHKLYGRHFADRLAGKVPTLVLTLTPGETDKNLRWLFESAERAVEWGVTRRSIVVAMGGGVPGNVGGMLAAMLYRGIRLISLPTTLVAVSDSVISYKQAVNSDRGKNVFGFFYRPIAIYADIKWLSTLTNVEMRSGLCELIKNALAIAPNTIPHLHDILGRWGGGNPAGADDLIALIQMGLQAKAVVMAEDPYERESAVVLEYGHTVGHAVELLASRRTDVILSHGEAVSIGMIAAARVSRMMERLAPAAVEQHEVLLRSIGAPVRLPAWVTAEQVLSLVRSDNKRGYLDLSEDEVAMVLLAGLGTPNLTGRRPLTAVPIKVLHDVLESMKEG